METYSYDFSLLPKGQSFTIPAHSRDGSVFHEVELGVMMKKGGRHHHKLSEWQHDIAGYFLLIDYTDFDVTKQAVQNGLPWYLAKA